MTRPLSMLLLLITCACAAPSPATSTEADDVTPAPAPKWSLVAFWNGNGMKQTEPFVTLSREWRINWETTNEAMAGAGILQIFVHDADTDALITLAGNQQGTGKDTSYVRAPAGRYYLQINSGNVDWSVEVEDQR